MTVSTQYTPISVAWTTSAQAIPITWPFFDDTLVVTYTDSDGVETVKSLTTHYTVSGGTDANGLPATGTVTMVGAASTGTLTVTRLTPRTQAATWPANDPFPQKTIEAALDKASLIAQEQAYAGGSGLQLDTSGATDYWDAESHVIRNVATPTADSDAATKDYVDGLVGVSSAEAAAASAQTASNAAATAVAAAEAVEAANLPSDLTGQANKVLQVNGDEDGWQFTTALAGDIGDTITAEFDTKSDAESYDPTTAPDVIRLRGYAAAGDGGGALYQKVDTEPSHPGKLQIAEGSWYELAEPRVDAKMLGALGDNSGTDDTAAIADAISVASEVRNGAQGSAVFFPQGVFTTTEEINIPNRVRLQGINKRGSIIKADAGFSDSYMFTAINGTSSMFDNPICDLTLNCNDVAGLSGIEANAWQEGGGLRRALVQKFRTRGLLIQNGFGGAALLNIDDVEMFGSDVAAATDGIRCNQISVGGNFVLRVSNTTIAGGGEGTELTRGIYMLNDSLHCHGVHFEYCTNGIVLDGAGTHVLVGVTGNSTVTSLVALISTFTGTVILLGCRKNGATNFVTDARSGGLGTVTSEHDHLVIGPVATATTMTTGTYTPDPADGAFQAVINGGAHTLAPLSKTGTALIQYTNNGSAGAVTTSGFTQVTGDSLTTVNGDDFLCFISTFGSFSHLNVVALQ